MQPKKASKNGKYKQRKQFGHAVQEKDNITNSNAIVTAPSSCRPS